MKRRVLNIFVGLYFSLMFVNAAVGAYQTMRSLNSYHKASDPGWRVEPWSGRMRVRAIDSDGPSGSQLRIGDEIVSINSKPLDSPYNVLKPFERIPPGSTYNITVRRDGQLLDFTLKTRPFPGVLLAIGPMMRMVIPGIFLFSGLALFLFRSEDKLALLLTLMFSALSGTFSRSPGTDVWQWLTVILTFALYFGTFFFPIFLHFFLLFPDPKGQLSPLLRRFPNIQWYLYIPYLLLIFSSTGIWFILFLFDPGRVDGQWPKFPWIWPLWEGVTIAYLIGGLISLLVNYREAGHTLRRKMRVVVAGSLAGFLLPILLLSGVQFLNRLFSVGETLLTWALVVAILSFPLFPLSILYAIFRHQVIPVRIIIRRGLRHLFVRQGSILLELIVVGIVLTLLLKYVFARMQIGHLAVGILSGAVAIAAWQVTQWLHYKVIAPAIDRAFFRRAYNAQMILSELSQALRVMSDWREERLAFVSMKIQQALQTDNVTIFLRDEKSGDYSSAVSSYYTEQGQISVASLPDLKLPRDAFVLQRLAESPRPLTVDFDDPNSWAFALAAAEGAVDEAPYQQNETPMPIRSAETQVSHHSSSWWQESKTLRQIRSALILPVATKDQLIGAISLGQRLGDLPFSREDRELLMAVAVQLSFAIENAQLVRHKVEEERMRRELEFASEVQRRLFPQCPPQIAQLELCGVCYPARDVGGDYYDFLELGNGELGIAVADVSGKGISAALLMSVIQASLRAQAPQINGQMTELIASMNRLLCESTGANHYATFFYAQLDWSARRLTYVNAGHNPPILVRAGAKADSLSLSNVAQAVNSLKSENGAEFGRLSRAKALASPSKEMISYLTVGGPVIGLLENCVYRNSTIELGSGDVLVAYTDGLSEARNLEGEEFGEERLTQIVVDNADLPANEMREQIIASIRNWQHAAPQHDDMTMVIVKVK
jgi:sigma-B regulation protein RsbU (phosphoserine phosphatase)